MSTPVTLPASVRAEPGEGGLPRLVVAGPSGSAEIYLQGAHVTSWAPVGQDPVLWMSRRSQYAAGSALRGGVPVCFPWFGPSASGGPLHGFARTTDWTLVDVVEQDDDVVLTFALEDTEASRASVWPHPFGAVYRVTVGATLRLELEVTNRGTVPFTFEEAFHTYLAVGDVREISIEGLEAMGFVDRLVGDGEQAPTGEPLRITGETDRVYAQPGTVVVHDPARRDLAVEADGSADVVVWNPWVAKSAAMADFGDDEWTSMVCVETGNVRGGAITLGTGASHTLTATIAAKARLG